MTQPNYQERLREILFKASGGISDMANEEIAAINALNAEAIGEDETGGYARGVQPVRNRLRVDLRQRFGCDLRGDQDAK